VPLLGTLAAAEACRRADLVRAVESELREVDPAAYAERRGMSALFSTSRIRPCLPAATTRPRSC
jgi:hypothetical protein